MTRLQFLLNFTMLLALTVSAAPIYHPQYNAIKDLVPRQPGQIGQAITDGGSVIAVDDANLISHTPAHLNIPRDVLPAKRDGGDLVDGNKVTLGVLAKRIAVTLERWQLERKLPWNVGTSKEDDENDVAFGVGLVYGLIKALEGLDRFGKGLSG